MKSAIIGIVVMLGVLASIYLVQESAKTTPQDTPVESAPAANPAFKL
jgi:hypothetical protein